MNRIELLTRQGMKLQFQSLQLFLLMLLFMSCKKQDINPDIPDQDPAKELLIPKIESWLDKQKTDLPTSSAAKINLLKESLDYNNLHMEKYRTSEDFIIVRVSDKFQSQNNKDKKPTNYLVVVLKNKDSVTKGNIIQYISSVDNKKVPKNTFSKIFNYQYLDCSGQFTILSITDYFRYELKFENGKIKSVKEIKEKNHPSNGSGRVNECIDWYEQTWFVWADGTAQLVSEVYVFTTCDGDCAQPRIANGRSYGISCNGNGGGGGVEYDVCVSSAISGFQSEANGAQAVSQKNGFDISIIDEFTKNKNPKWTILKGWSGWTLESQEIGVIKLIDQATNKWAWKSLVHGSISMVGTPTPGVGIEYNQGVGTASFTPETAAATTVLYGGMSLNYNVTFRFLCNCPNLPVVNLIPPIIRSYTSGAIWDANPI